MRIRPHEAGTSSFSVQDLIAYLSHPHTDELMIDLDTSPRRLLGDLRRDDVVFYSPTAIQIGRIVLSGTHHSVDLGLSTLERGVVDGIAPRGGIGGRVVGIGNGRALDVAKYIAAQNNCEFIAIPATLSTNAAFTPSACLQESGRRVSVPAKAASRVLIDIDLLRCSDFKSHLIGLSDVLSIETALADWEAVSGDQVTPLERELHQHAAAVLADAADLLPVIAREDNHSLRAILALLARSGALVREAGSGRTVSGSEHIFARALEDNTRMWHGVAVAIGILLMAEIHRRPDGWASPAIVRFATFSDLHNRRVSRSLVHQVLSGLAVRTDRPTILDLVPLDATLADRVISEVVTRWGAVF